MEGLTESETSNVIEVQFKQNLEDIPIEIEHPASKNYAEELDDDPLYDLLHEFDDIELNQDAEIIKEDFIFHLVGAKEINLELKQSAVEMSKGVLSQVERLKEDFKRIKFYLDEMNIDD